MAGSNHRNKRILINRIKQVKNKMAATRVTTAYCCSQADELINSIMTTGQFMVKYKLVRCVEANAFAHAEVIICTAEELETLRLPQSVLKRKQFYIVNESVELVDGGNGTVIEINDIQVDVL
jgi:hypothetical protein